MDEIIKELHSLKLSGMARLWASLAEVIRNGAFMGFTR